MNCVKVQEAIWCAELTYEMQQHIATCEDCLREQAKIQNLHFSLEHVPVPPQSRSLLPSKEEIAETMRARKRQRFTKWGIGGVAAAACVLAAVMVVPTFLHSGKGVATDQTATSKPPQTSADTPTTLEKRTDPSDQSRTPDTSSQQSTTDPTGPSSTTATSPSIAPAQPSTAIQPYVTVADGIDAKYVQLAAEIQGALTQSFDTSLFQHITILKMEPDTQNTDATNLSYVVTLDVQHQPGKGSAYGDGDVTTTRFAHFSNNRGMWDFTGLSTSPALLPDRSNDWHEVFVKNTSGQMVATFKVPPFLAAQNQSDGSVILTNQGKQMGLLELEMQVPHSAGDYSHAVSLPNGAKVVNQQTLTNSTGVHIVQYTLQYDAPAGSGAEPATGTRLYFMHDDKVAYDLSFPDGAISADNLKQIIDGFDIIPTP